MSISQSDTKSQELKALQKALSRQDYPEAVNLCHLLLSGFLEISQSHESPEDFYLSLANSISQLMVDKRFEMSNQHFQILSAHHANIAMTYVLAGFANADHVFYQIANCDDINNIEFPDLNSAFKCLLLYSLNSRFDLDIHGFSEEYPKIVTPILLGLLGTRCLITKNTEERFNEILDLDWSHLEEYEPTLSNMLSMSNAWMFCSYGHIENKHQIKKTLNKILFNWHNTGAERVHNFELKINRPKHKKVILIPLEMMRHNHAMFRCFSRILAKLKEHFHTVALSAPHLIDEISSRYFSEVITFNPATMIQHSRSFINQIKKLEADAVYYPSLGMANTILILANHRIAPIQLYTLGHPATTHIDCMDYAVIQEQDLCRPRTELRNIFSEKILVIGNETSSTLSELDKPSNGEDTRTEKHPLNKDILNIAITSTHMKINYTFFETCRTIASLSKKTICYYVFPGASGPTLDYLSLEFKHLLGNCKVFSTMSYQDYMKRLSECSLRLGTFPFGGANSNMDCFSLGIPFIALDGNEVHSQSDVGQLIQAGLYELVAKSRADYIDKASKLIEDESYRNEIKGKMLKLKSHPFFNGSISEQGDFAKTLHRLFKEHKNIQSSPQQIWDLR